MAMHLKNNLSYFRVNKLTLDEYKYISEYVAKGNVSFENMSSNRTLKKILDAIAIANPNFYTNISTERGQLKSKQVETIVKYASRATFDSVPLYDFASVFRGAEFSVRKVKCVIDRGWLYSFIDRYVDLEKMFSISKESLKISINNNVIKEAGYFCFYKADGSGIDSVIKSNPELDIIYKLLKKPIKYSNFLRILRNEYGIEKVKATDITLKLASIKFIVYEFERGDCLESYIDAIPSKIVDDVRLVIHGINIISNRFTIDDYIKLCTVMNRLVESNTCLNVVSSSEDTVDRNSYNETFNNIHDMLCDFDKISNGFISVYSRKIHEYFIDKYGSKSYVPLSKIVYDEVLMNLINNQKLEINVIFDEILAKYRNELESIRICHGKLDLANCNFIQNVYKELKAKYGVANSHYYSGELLFDGILTKDGILRDLSLSQEIGSNSIGNMSGRFIDILGLDNEYKLYMCKDVEKSFSPLKVIYDFEDKRIDNVDSQISEKNILAINKIGNYDSEYISLEDLVVYSESNRLGLMNLENGRKVILKNYNSINPENGSDILKTISYLGQYNTLNDLLSRMQDLQNKEFCDVEVCYGKIVLFSRHFLINKNILISILTDKVSSIKRYLNEYFDRSHDCRIRNEYLFKFGDVKYICNINSDNETESLLVMLRSCTDDDIMIASANSCLEGDCKNVQIVSEYEYISNHDAGIPFNKNEEYIDEVANIDEVIYFKLYMKKEFEKIFIEDYLLKIEESIIENIDERVRLSYVRYLDERNHIRLRFFLNGADRYKVESEIINLLSRCDIITDYTISNYFRESNRYGGHNGMLFYENYQTSETNLILETMNRKLIDNVIILQLFIALKITRKFKKGDVAKNLNLGNARSLQSFKKKLHANKKMLVKKIERLSVGLKEDHKMKLIVENYDELLDEYAKYLSKRMIDNEYIYESMIHMMCNRTTGIDRRKEDMLRQALKELMGFDSSIGIKI